MHSIGRQIVALVAVLLVASSCSSSPPTRYYVLKPAAYPESASTVPHGARVSIGPVTISEGLDQSNIVTVVKGHELRVADSMEWVAPLDESVAQVVTENLSQLLHTNRISRYPTPAAVAVDYQVPLDVVRLGGRLGQQAFLDVRWSILGLESKEIMREKTSLRRALPDSSYGALAAAISAMLGDLSKEIADALQAGRLPPRGS